MANNNIKHEKDAFDVMFELMDKNPEIGIDEIAAHLTENGYAKSIDSVKRFFLAMGVEE